MASLPPPAPLPPTSLPPSKQGLDWSRLIPTIIYGLITLAILAVIGWGLTGKQGFLASLADKEVARGLITFLIAITTVGIAVILGISTIFGSDGDGEDKRFDRGKQVLTSLIGILGTIVGFYYGTSTENKGSAQPATAQQQQGYAIAPARLSNAQPKRGEKVTISSFIVGGKAPYTYSIVFDDAILNTIKDKPSTDGVIREEITIPADLNADKNISFQISAKDSDSKTVDSGKNGDQKIAAKAK